MSIVNQTIPLSLKTLGYDQSEIDAIIKFIDDEKTILGCLLYTSPSPRDRTRSRMPSSA